VLAVYQVLGEGERGRNALWVRGYLKGKKCILKQIEEVVNVLNIPVLYTFK
jgi:hypothetical protein